MKSRCLSVLILVVSLAFSMQAQTLTYSKTILSDSSQNGTRMQELADGSLMAFTSSTDSGFMEFACHKLDARGNLLWSKRYGGGVSDLAVVTAKSSTDEIYVAGDTRSFGSGLRDIFLSKMDTAGNILWTRVIGGPGDDGPRALCVAANGDLVLSGVQYGLGISTNNIIFFRFDPSGNLLVRKMMGDIQNQSVYHIQEYSPNKFLMLGNHLTGGTNMDFLAMMVDGVGNILWARTYDGGVWDRYTGSMVYTPADGRIMLPFMPGGTGWNDPTTMGLIQFDSLGNFGFARQYAPGGYDRTYIIHKTDSGFVLAGNSDSYTGATRGFFMAVNDSGVPQRTWLDMQGYRSSVSQIFPSVTGGHMLQGNVSIVDSIHFSLLIGKLDSTWSICDDSTVTTPWTDLPMTVGTPSYTTLDTGFMSAVAFTQYQVSMQDTFLCYSCPTPVVNFGWTAQDLDVTLNNLSSGGITAYLWDFGDGTTDTTAHPSHSYTSYGTHTICLYATNACGTDSFCQVVDVLVGMNEPAAKHVLLYPNPCHEQVSIQSIGNQEGIKLVVTDLLGQTILQQQMAAGTTEAFLDLSALPAGCWILRLEGGDWIQTERLVKR